MSVISRSTLAVAVVAVAMAAPVGVVLAAPGGSGAGQSAGASPGAGAAVVQETPNETATTPGGNDSAGNGSAAGDGPGNDTDAPTDDGVGAIESYDGAHVGVGVEPTTLTDYTVDGTTYFDSLAVQSRTDAQAAGLADIGVSLPALNTLPGANLTVTSRTEANLDLRTGSGAALSVHDNEHGIVVVRSNRGTQYVLANVSGEAEAAYEGDSQVIVTNEERAEASVTVVGNGSVGVNDEGNVVAELGRDGILVVRAYQGKRGTDDRRQEQFVADGVATGEVYVMDRANGTVVDTVVYENETTLNASASNGTVNLTVDRSQKQGAVVFTSVTETVADRPEEVTVLVDGETVPTARTYAQLRVAANNGPESRYKVSPSTQPGAVADVAIAINHFSAREVTIRGLEANGTNATTTATTTAEGPDGSNGSNGTVAPNGSTGTTNTSVGNGTGGESTGATSPGFGALVALLAVAAVALAAGLRGRVR
ncbi:hypothetical protein ACFO0N_10140 [Halobium salinum]|uniref:PGF-CTERM sorting domain-containing protein n=1 Tax=Halobium salinum TaxID=1364940 RepID=A0ABD5PBJ2_9EURY|nr:hypothetical protein [Halobium salinum]